MNRTSLHRLTPLLSVGILGLTLWVLARELHTVHYHQILNAVRQLPLSGVLVAFGFAVLSYALLSGYDALALVYIRRVLPYRNIALASFIATAFSHSTGFLIGAPLRYRFYTGWGLTTGDIARVLLFSYTTFWLGLSAVTATALLIGHSSLAATVGVADGLLLGVGLVLAALVLGYVTLSVIRRTPVVVRRWRIAVPSLRLAAGQIVVAAADWIASAIVLYMLLPAGSGIPFSAFLAVFMFGHVAGFVSQVPGGLGVFETIMLLALGPVLPVPAVLGALFVFRVVYYIVPLCIAAVLVGISELVRHRQNVSRAAQLFGQWWVAIAPQALALSSFVGGAILLFSGATPSIHGRLLFLERFVPLPVVELSHFLGSVAGAGLLLVARGLQRRLDAAYYLTAGLLGFGIVFSLLKGGDFEEAIILSLMLAALVPCRSVFTRRSLLIREPFSRGWIVAVALVLMATLWLGVFSYKHVDYSHDLWWRFELRSDAPRSLRAAFGAIMLLLFYGFARLVKLAPTRSVPAAAEELDLAASLVAASPRTAANLALLGDKLLLFSETRRSFIMYGVENRSWVALGDPVGSEDEFEDLVWRFRDLCERHSGWPVFYQVDATHLPLFIDLGLTLIKLGEEARVPLESFSLEGRANKNLRHSHSHGVEEGLTFEIIPRDSVPDLLPVLQAISDKWLARHRTREKGFSLGSFDPVYLARFPLALVRVHGEPLAFANLWEGADHEELSVDLMRHREMGETSVMDFLFIELMLWGKAQGYRWFNLGMAPLAGLGDRALAPLWSKLGAFVFRHGENFYNFKGLYRYKDKFKPVWEPRYLASPGGLALPVIATNIATLISGGIKGVVSK